MIKLIYEPDEENILNVKRIEIEAVENGHISDYVEAFGAFLRAVSFTEGTIEEALPTMER